MSLTNFGNKDDIGAIQNRIHFLCWMVYMNWCSTITDFFKPPRILLTKRSNAFFYITVIFTDPTQTDSLSSLLSCGFSSSIESDLHPFRLFHSSIESDLLPSSLLFRHLKSHPSNLHNLTLGSIITFPQLHGSG